MQYPISNLVNNMAESATLKMAALGAELKSQGKDIISLSLGEPDFNTPNFIIEAAYKALKDGYTKYTPVPGLIELRQAISDKFKRENNLDYKLNEIVSSNGAKQCIADLSLAILNSGDEVIIFAPYWVSYFEIIRLSGAKPVIVKAGIDQDYKVTADQLAEAITPKTKFVLFSSPCNPTGSVYEQSELEAIAKVIEQHENLLVVADEIYEHINFTDKHFSIGSIPSMKERTITVNGFSKGFAMTGWRLGYMGAPAPIAKACVKIQGQFTSGAAAANQMAGAVALNSPLDETIKMKDAYLRRRDLIIGLLKEIPDIIVNKPMGAFYIFPDISAFFGKSYNGKTISNSDDFSMYLLEEALVATVSGSAFGADDCFRISYAASEENIIEAIRRIKEALAKLK